MTMTPPPPRAHFGSLRTAVVLNEASHNIASHQMRLLTRV